MISNIQPQQQTIVKSGWIIEAIFIQDEGFGQRANFQQMMPIERTAREPRDLQTHNQADMAESDGSRRDVESQAGRRRRLLIGPDLDQ